MLASLNRFIKSFSFLKAIVLAFAMISPVFFANYFLGDIHLGFSISLGVLFCSPTDVQGSLKHKFFGLLAALIISFSITLLLGSISFNLWVLLPVLSALVFLVSYISVFGFRASLISFSGLLAIVLSFAYEVEEMSLLMHSMLVAIGGLWYLLLTMSASLLLPKIQTDQLFVEVAEKTAEFLKVRGQLLVCTTKRDELYSKLFQLQSEINDSHESLREIILSKRLMSGFSNRTRRQQLFFSELIEILELAVSNPVNYEKFDEVFKDHSEKTEAFKNLIFEISNQLLHISKVIGGDGKVTHNEQIPGMLKKISLQIDYYRILVGLPKSRVGTLMLLNLKNYLEKQAQSVISIERIINNYKTNDKILGVKDADRFITPQDYDLKKLKENFSLKSPIFKHSLRLVIVVIIGFFIGSVFSMQNPYWILLTLVVIMRPSYGLTKERSKNRVLGTLIGAAIATVIFLVTQNAVIFGVIAVISLPLAFSLIQSNYRNGAIFITLHVVFVYALLEPNTLSVIKFRVLDTLIGAALAIAANYVLWPSWQFQNIHEYFMDAIKANKLFLKQIDSYYHKKGEVPTSYSLSRKEAFLNIGNLNAAYQRMNQDPKSKQKELATIYDIITINNTFLSSLTSLGVFIRNNKTAQVPKQFTVFVKYIVANLELANNLLEGKTAIEALEVSEIENAKAVYDNYFDNLSKQRDQEIEDGKEISIEMGEMLKETQLVSEQVKWLFNLSEKLINSIKHYKSNL
ncbi:Uncharacterized membrane protein YccC [Lutibacter oricola]|uniref:Uncharacterized membrane protein YccC n=1 Tax=Lutibacter oricola TaxID=762486 RepID=A0A1H2YWM1_9FLAO|nr:FUSC family membrane protein [Lutibacter oricola]SDX08969.1 Uncharacterized membrane protein YccC [Lutibacter oricola]